MPAKKKTEVVKETATDDVEKRAAVDRRAERAAAKQAERDADPNEYGYGRGY